MTFLVSTEANDRHRWSNRHLNLSPLFFLPKQCEPLLKTSQPEAQSIKTKTVAVIGAGVAGVSQDPEPLPLTKQSLAEGLRPRLEDARPV